MQDMQVPVALFRLGKILITINARELIPSEDVAAAIRRHQAGDWGDIDDPGKASNERAIMMGKQILSTYRSSLGTKFFLITEGDRSITTVLLPEDQ